MLQKRGGFFLTVAGLLAWGSAAAIAESDLFVVTTADFETGSTALLAAGAEMAQTELLSPIHGDAVARYQDGKIYIVERFLGDNIIVLDPQDLRTPVVQFSVGNGANPQDIELFGADKAYVSRYNSAALLVVDPRDGSELGEIDLSGLADADGLPEMGEMAAVGSRLYVALQRLDNFAPTEFSYLAVIDMNSDAVVDMDPDTEGVQGIRLATTNPNEVVAVGQKVFVAGVAGFGDRAGGLEVVDIETNQSGGVVISEEALGGDLTALAMASQERGFAVVLDDNFAYQVRPVDLVSGVVGAALEGHSGGFTPALAVDGERLVVADRGPFDDPDRGGLLIYDVSSGALLRGPISTGLPPAGLAVLKDAGGTAVLEEAMQVLPQQASLSPAYPNPFNAATTIPFMLESAQAHMSLAVYDSLGRQVRVLEQGPLQAGRYVYSWDGRNEAGKAVGNGAYLIQLRLGQNHLTSKVMLVK
jgi:hypothetical protein